MSEARRRELEREWALSASTAAEAALLLDRVRTGELELERLRAAALARHPAACRALAFDDPIEDSLAWIRDLQASAPAAMPYARLALCWKLADRWRNLAGAGDLDPVVYAAQEFLYEPSRRTSRELIEEVRWIPGAQSTGSLRTRMARTLVTLVRAAVAAIGGPELKQGVWCACCAPLIDWERFLARALWVFDATDLYTWIGEAVGAFMLYGPEEERT